MPGIVTSVLTFLLQISLFRSPASFVLNKDEIHTQLAALGPLSSKEKRVIFWVATAILFWVTDSIHHVNPGWVGISCAIAMSLPKIGDILKPPDWAKVNIGTLFFLTAALGIGTVDSVSGMNKWVAGIVLTAHVPGNMFVFAATVTGVTVVIHAVLGSAMAVMGIVTPTVVAYTAGSGMNPMIPALLVCTASASHFFLPFHRMNLPVGAGDGETSGRYSDGQILRLGIPLTALIFIVTVCVEIPWWKFIDLIK